MLLAGHPHGAQRDPGSPVKRPHSPRPHGQQGLLPDLWTYAPCCRAQTLGHKRPPLLPVDTRKGLRAKVLLAQRDGGSPIRPSTRRGSEVSRV